MLIGFIFCKIGIWIWQRKLPPSDPVLRFDLVFIYPVLIVFDPNFVVSVHKITLNI